MYNDSEEKNMKQGILFLVFCIFGSIFIAVTGCDMHTKGKKIYESSRCPECHTLNGKGGSAGPNLTYVGNRRSRNFIIQQLKDPKKNDPNTNMPSFGSLSEQDISALADYLSNLK